MRQDDRTADQLIGLLGIDAEANRDIDGLIELRGLELLEKATAWSTGNGVSPGPFATMAPFAWELYHDDSSILIASRDVMCIQFSKTGATDRRLAEGLL